jgi:undecaprenyl-diphosphatase
MKLEFFYKIILAIIQGLTEFLPISSSGHLALASHFLKIEQNLFFYVVLHFSSLLAVLIYFRKDLIKLLYLNKKEVKKKWKYIILGIIPAGIFGLLFNNLIENSFNNIFFLGFAYLFGGSLILLSKGKEKFSGKLNNRKSFLIGLMQCLAIFPGVSRSGTTTTTGMLQGIDAKKAGEFSFLLFVPLSIGALILEIMGGEQAHLNLELFFSGIVCFFVSLFSLKIFFMTIKKGWFWIFGIYCLILGLSILTYSFL